jgi:hypothetical protein
MTDAELKNFSERAEADKARNIAAIVARVDANELEAKTISEFARLVYHGYKFIDIHVRKDGREYRFEGDWLARLFRGDAA